MDAVFFQVNGRSNRGGRRAILVFEPPLSETPSTNSQAPEKFQISNSKPQPIDAVANGAQVVF